MQLTGATLLFHVWWDGTVCWLVNKDFWACKSLPLTHFLGRICQLETKTTSNQATVGASNTVILVALGNEGLFLFLPHIPGGCLRPCWELSIVLTPGPAMTEQPLSRMFLS